MNVSSMNTEEMTRACEFDPFEEAQKSMLNELRTIYGDLLTGHIPSARCRVKRLMDELEGDIKK